VPTSTLADRCASSCAGPTSGGKLALIMDQRYAHARHFKRANRMLGKLKT
jgi:hypothetical protein